jgi:hypothetical protein
MNRARECVGAWAAIDGKLEVQAQAQARVAGRMI